MLDGLERIDWESLEHAYGEASDVPEQLRGLRSADEKVREWALRSLYGNIFHQGTRYEATAHAVPFLFELAEDPVTPGRHLIIDLLVHLALGYAEAYLPWGIDPERDFAPYVEAEADEDEGEGDWAAYARSAYEAVKAGVGQFVKWARDPDAQVQEAAVYALAWFPRQARISAPVVRHIAMQDESYPTGRANALLSLAMLDRALGSLEDTALFDGLLGQEAAPVVRLAAAVALGITGDGSGGGLPKEALSVMLTAVGGGGSDQDVEVGLRWNDGDLVGLASQVLSAGVAAAVPGDELDNLKERVVEAVCRALPSATPMSSLTLTQSLLDAAFHPAPDLSPEVPSTFTPLQQRALQAIAEHGAWRVGTAHFGNYSSLVSAYGLPGTEEQFRQLVSTLSTPR